MVGIRILQRLRSVTITMASTYYFISANGRWLVESVSLNDIMIRVINGNAQHIPEISLIYGTGTDTD